MAQETMINGFEEETKPLTTEEISMVSMFVKGFEGKIGEENAVTAGEIEYKMKARGYTMSGARVRKIVNYIRVKKLVKNLVATSKGYYIETDSEKVKLYIAGLKARADAIMAVANSYQ